MRRKKAAGAAKRDCITRVSVIGLGKLGFSMTAAFAKRGLDVTGVDVNSAAVRKINAGFSPINETGVQDLLQKHRARIRATMSVADAITRSEITFVVVGTPSGRDGAFLNDQLLAAADEIGGALRRKDDYHVVAVTCTVMPGTTAGEVRPALERASGKKCGRDFGLVYNPEFIALGSVVSDFLNPDFILIGECDAQAGRIVADLYGQVCENNAPIARMTATEAEIAKIALNCYCTTKISFANMIAELAERIQGVDAAVITRAIGLDRRIGGMYLQPGLGFGGPCFPRDNTAFRAFAERLGIDAPIPDAVRAANRRQAARVARKARRLLPRGGKVAVLGLSYKPATHVVEQSQAMEIAASLARDERYAVAVYDPMAMNEARAALGKRVKFCGAVDACLKNADLCIIATAWPEFRRLTAETLIARMRRPRVIDCWRLLAPREAAMVEYTAIGLGGRQTTRG